MRLGIRTKHNLEGGRQAGIGVVLDKTLLFGRIEGIPFILIHCADDRFVHERVGKALDLYPIATLFTTQDTYGAAARAGISTEDRL